MSIMVCIKCDRYVDTDFDVEGIWVDENEKPSLSDPINLVCSNCIEDHFTHEQIEKCGQ